MKTSRKRTAMNVRQLRISRRSITIAAALAGVVSLAIGAHAALNKRALDAAKAIATEQSDAAGKRVAKLALVIGNGHYPDANAPLSQPINDARALTAALRGNGFDVDVVEDASRDYMIPVDAAIWRESDVRRQGLSVESVLDVMKEQGARAKLVVIDASRRNPYERRFRAFSHGLAPIDTPDNALILSSATPGKVAEDSEGTHSVLMSELLQNLTAEAGGVESVFNKTRVAISRASDGEQVPTVSSSLAEDLRLATPEATENVGG